MGWGSLLASNRLWELSSSAQDGPTTKSDPDEMSKCQQGHGCNAAECLLDVPTRCAHARGRNQRELLRGGKGKVWAEPPQISLH